MVIAYVLASAARVEGVAFLSSSVILACYGRDAERSTQAPEDLQMDEPKQEIYHGSQDGGIFE